MKTVPIIFCFDTSFEMPAGVCITSLLESAAPDTFYDIFILHSPESDFSGSALNLLPGKYGNCRITFRKVDGEFIGGYEVRGIPEITYYKLISPEIIPEYDKFLYSDVDVIFREDMTRYYETDLGDNYFGAVSTCPEFRPAYQGYLQREYGYDWHDGYFYAGNLVINSSLLLRDGKLEEFRRMGKNKYDQQDMSILNLACKGRILSLPPAYCLATPIYNLITGSREKMEQIYGKEEIERALSSGIVHYNGAKPWNAPCLNADIWWSFYRRSVFFDEKFCHDFWKAQGERLQRLGFMKRIKLLLRYPLDKKNLK